jgi:DUF4097 and DUF4098 domain-containing protein YvlB
MNKLKIKSGAIRFSKLFLVLALLSGVLFSGCSLFQKKYEKTEKKEITVSTVNKKKVVLNNTNGDIKITKSPVDSVLRVKAEVTYRLTKKELAENIERIKFEVDSSSDVIKINADYVRIKRIFNFDLHIGNNIDYELFVPEGIEVSIDNTNGKTEVTEISNKLDINQTNGRLNLTHPTGYISADLTNGKITGDLDSSKGLNLKSTNGNISLTLSSTFSGKFRIETTNGKIVKKDFDFRDVNDDKKLFRGTLGNGDADIRLETTNGKITLIKK